MSSVSPITLSEQLAQVTAHVRSIAPPDVFSLMEAGNAEVAATGLVAKSLQVGATLPIFSLPNATGKIVRSDALLQKGFLLISFYRGQWCPYCNLELKALQAHLPQIEAMGVQLVAISPQTPDFSLSMKEKNELAFEVLSDTGNAYAKKLGIVFSLSQALRPVYESFGIDLSAHNGTEGDASFELPVPATYLVSPEGRVLERFVNVDYRERLEPSTVLAWLEKHAAHALAAA
jgi:peroxiredoxin